jgi:antitoxin component YwqK of YwqJK toxin-antitoxin module
MQRRDAKSFISRLVVLLSFCIWTGLALQAQAAVTEKLTDSNGREFLVSLPTAPFTQAAVKQTPASARVGPNPKVPFFHVRFALPIPPDNSPPEVGAIAGIDPAVMGHLHSPGFEMLPNGDALAIFFSAKDSSGASECDTNTCFVQARLRYGAEEWDPPELFFDFKDLNDQSGLLWRDGGTIRFFGGGRGEFPLMPFKMAVSTNNGATWAISLPFLDAPARDYTSQPIANAFRGSDGGIYFAMDGAKDESFLWRSMDNGIHWHDMGGRTAARHSTIVPLDNTGRLLSIGGKNASVEGWNPQTISTDYGATWAAATKSAFPALGGNQRPCMIKLANGHLCLVTDGYHRKKKGSPAGWKFGEGCVVAISQDNGNTWHIKGFPVELPHETDRKRGTLGYATVRQGPNGVIHLLTTMTHPCLHYEFNEAWALSDAADLPLASGGGVVKPYSEKYPDGKVRISWSARICSDNRYLLDGSEVSYYENGQKEHEVTYINGRKTGEEFFWDHNGNRIWTWTHQPEKNSSTWVQYWNNGRKRLESNWNTLPRARDLDRKFFGLAADGTTSHWNQDGSLAAAYSFKNGELIGPLPLSAAK